MRRRGSERPAQLLALGGGPPTTPPALDTPEGSYLKVAWLRIGDSASQPDHLIRHKLNEARASQPDQATGRAGESCLRKHQIARTNTNKLNTTVTKRNPWCLRGGAGSAAGVGWFVTHWLVTPVAVLKLTMFAANSLLSGLFPSKLPTVAPLAVISKTSGFNDLLLERT